MKCISRLSPCDLSDLKLITLCVCYNPIPNYLLLLGFRNCRKLCITISDSHLLRFSHSFLIHVTLGHCSPSVYDSNFYTMKFSMCAAESRSPLAASFFILHDADCSVNNFLPCFLKFFNGIFQLFSGLLISIFLVHKSRLCYDNAT